MRFELTLRSGDRERDVAVVTPARLLLGAVRDELARHVDAAPCGDWHSDGALLGSDARFGSAQLRTGSIVTFGTSGRPEAGHSGYLLHIVGGPSAGRVLPVERGELRIGRDADCEIRLDDDRASREHATLRVANTSLTVRDHGSTNGTTIDGVRVDSAGRSLAPGQILHIGDSLLAVSARATDAAACVLAADTILVNRAPRQVFPVDEREIPAPLPPSTDRPRPVQWLGALLPLAAAGALAWFAHSAVFLLFALLSPVMLLGGALGDRLHWRRSRRRDAAAHRAAHARSDAQIAAALGLETVARRDAAPDPAALAAVAALPGARLWERRRHDFDHLRVRVGSADLPSALRVRDGPSCAAAGVVPDVPLTVDLRRGPLGVVGPADVVAGVARWLVAQLAVLHSPADVDLALLLSAEAAAGWTWARWLPHLGGRVAIDTEEWAPLVSVLTAAAAHRRSRDGRRDTPDRWLLVVVDRARALTDVPGLPELLSDADGGVTALCIDTDVQALPTSCVTVAEVADGGGSRVSLRGGRAASAVLDLVSLPWADGVARALAPLTDSGDDAAAIPAACRLLDLLDAREVDVGAVLSRWAASDGRPDTVLGRCPDGPLVVDLATDGPHALVAGTTGAGKSELLQTLVAGLAMAHPPEEVTFLLIDYKGGAAFADCADLPHTAGLVTDLDPHLTRRALVSLDAEVRRRERLLGAAGVADLDAYRATANAAALPRLVIVVDEFAALAQELPDFVHGLVGIAQRGRSLGLHLVLATQRPGSVVSPSIRANTSLRIALRVTDASESSDVIDAPDAASIDPGRPGRAYVRSARGLTCFQTARVGGEVPSNAPAVLPLGPWRRPLESPQQNDAPDALRGLVRTLADAAHRSGRPPATSPWRAPLPAVLFEADLPASDKRRGPTHKTDATRETDTIHPAEPIPLGLLDSPAEQAQPVLTIDLDAATSLLVAGAAGTGRSTALAALALTAAARRPPAELEIYVADAGGALAAALADLPQVATCLGPSGASLVPRLFERLDSLCAVRSACPAPVAMLLLVDDWDRHLSARDDADALLAGDLLTGLMRAGPGAGLTVAVAGDRSLLSPRVAGTFEQRLLLRLADRGDYGLVGLSPDHVPVTMPAGRGVRVADGLEFQLAHPGDEVGAQALRAVARHLERRWRTTSPSPGAVRLRPLPQRMALHDLPRERPRGTAWLGVAGDDARPLALDPFAGSGRWLVAGPPRSGRTTVLATLLAQAGTLGGQVVVAAPARSPLTTLAGSSGIPVLAPTDRPELIGESGNGRTLLLIDDSDAFADTEVGDRLVEWLRTAGSQVSAVLAGRCDDLATSYRGPAAEVRRSRCGILLRPGPIDGELFGLQLPRGRRADPPGRGLVVGEPSWGPPFERGAPVPIQVAQP